MRKDECILKKWKKDGKKIRWRNKLCIKGTIWEKTTAAKEGRENKIRQKILCEERKTE